MCRHYGRIKVCVRFYRKYLIFGHSAAGPAALFAHSIPWYPYTLAGPHATLPSPKTPASTALRLRGMNKCALLVLAI